MLKDFLGWLTEMVGTGVVSPKPGADYQIWGDPKASARITSRIVKKRHHKKKK